MSNRDKASEQVILLGLLDTVERGDVTQRSLSNELGIEVGLVNTYVKRAIGNRLIKVKQIPSRRYGYYLTPKAFVEKSQLIASYFIHSFDFFRRARASCEASLSKASVAGHKRIGLLGASELTEITTIVTTEIDVEIVVVVDAHTEKKVFLGIPVAATLASINGTVDAVMITNLSEPQAAYESAVAVFGKQRVYMPSVLEDIVALSRRPSAASDRRVKK